MSDAAQELEDLTELLESPGWRRFAEYVERSYGESMFGARVSALLAQPDSPNLLDRIIRERMSADVARELLYYPVKRIRQLTPR